MYNGQPETTNVTSEESIAWVGSFYGMDILIFSSS